MKMIKTPIVKRLSAKIGISALFTLLFVLTFSLVQQQATYATLAGFDPGNIMEDVVMSKKNSMTQTQIQTFLKSKNSCNDTNLSRLTGYNSTDKNKATQGWVKTGGKTFYYNLKNGHFVCMADQSFNGESAAHIIWQAGQDYNVNPQVLIVLLEKEQGLVTDTWPNTNYQYAAATGYDCPDTGSGCNNENSGFKTQVRKAAGLFHEVLNGGWSNYPVGNNYIQYNPSASCGGSTVNIRNRATSALYRYTPYQPNRAALQAGWGEAPCGAYGNRNFYNLFTTWFGSTRGTIDIKGIDIEQQPFIDTTTTVSFTITNNTKKTVSLPSIGVAVRDPNNMNLDFPRANNISLTPGQSYTYRKSRILNGAEGTYNFFIARYDGTSWHYPPFDDYGQIANGGITETLTKKPTLISSLDISKDSENFHVNQNMTASFTIKNNSAIAIRIGRVKPIVRDQRNQNYDFPMSYQLELAPGSTYTYRASRSLPKIGKYSVWIGNHRSEWGWTNNFPVSATPSLVRTRTIDVQPAVTLTSRLSVSMVKPISGQPATATFTIKNYSNQEVEVGYVKPAVRDSKGVNYDFPNTRYMSLAPGEEYNYSASRILPKAEVYSIWIAGYLGSTGWTTNWPMNETSGLTRSLKLNLKNEVRLVDGLAISTTDRRVTGTFRLKNYSGNYTAVGKFKIAARDQNGKNYDLSDLSYNIGLGAGQEYTHTRTRELPRGTYTFWVASYRNGKWSASYPISEDSSVPRKSTVTVD